MSEEFALSEEDIAACRAAFDGMDTDGNGTIDRHEARKDIIKMRKACMGNHGETEPVAETAESSPLNKLADAEVGAMFERCDENADDVISFEEYLAATTTARKIASEAQKRRKRFLVELNRPYSEYAAEEQYKQLMEDEFKRHRMSFMMIDINGDGCIERHEAIDEIARKRRVIFGNAPEEKAAEGDAVVDPHTAAAQKEVDSMFSKIDFNHDEVITFGEYLEGCYVPGQFVPEVKAVKEEPTKERCSCVVC